MNVPKWEKTEIEGSGNGVSDGCNLERGVMEGVRRDRRSVGTPLTTPREPKIRDQDPCRNPLLPRPFEDWLNRRKRSIRQVAGVGVGIGGEVAGTRTLPSGAAVPPSLL